MDRCDVLDVVIAHRRNEIAVRHARFDRAETQAAGLSVATVALAGLAASLLINIGRGLGLVAIVSVVAGAACLVIGFVIAFASRDTQTKMSRWFKVVVPRETWRRFTQQLIDDRLAYNRMEAAVEEQLKSLESLDPIAARRHIAEWQRKRLALVRRMAASREKAVRIAALLFVTGGGFLLLGVLLTATDWF